MATDLSFAEYLAEQADGAGAIRYKKMFGEYMLYCDEKPVFLICDDTLFVKVLKETEEILGAESEKAPPYDGAKPHFVVSDIDDRELIVRLAKTLAAVLPYPKKKK